MEGEERRCSRLFSLLTLSFDSFFMCRAFLTTNEEREQKFCVPQRAKSTAKEDDDVRGCLVVFRAKRKKSVSKR